MTKSVIPAPGATIGKSFDETFSCQKQETGVRWGEWEKRIRQMAEREAGPSGRRKKSV
jgi:hypothetical protein